MRRLWLIGMLGLTCVACTPTVSGVVFFDANQKGTVEKGAVGVAGIPVELYQVATTDNSSNSGGGSLGASANTNPNPNPLVSSSAAKFFKDTTPTDPYGSTVVTNPPVVAPFGAKPNGTLVATITTDQSGGFDFSAVAAGDYEVRIGDDAFKQGYRLTTRENPIHVSAKTHGSFVRFGVYRQGLQLLSADCPATITFPDSAACEQRYRNEAPVALHNVQLYAFLPNSIEIAPKNGGVFLHEPREVHWFWPTIAPGETVTAGFLIIPQPSTAASTPVSVTWRFVSQTDAQEILLQTLSTNVSTQAHVEMTIKGPSDPQPGAEVTYEIVAQNSGTRQVRAPTLVVTLPAAVTYISSDRGGSLDDTAHTVTWTLDPMNLNALTSRYVTVRLPALITDSLDLNFHAQITSSDLETPAETTVQPTHLAANVALQLTVDGTPDSAFIEDGVFVWNAVLTQTGSATLSNVLVIATLGDGLELQSQSAGATFDADKHTLTWNFPTLATGTPQTFMVQARPVITLTGLSNPLRVTFSVTAKDLSDALTKSDDVIAKHKVNE